MQIWNRLTPAGHGVFVALVVCLGVGLASASALGAWLATLAGLGLLALGLGMVITWRW